MVFYSGASVSVIYLLVIIGFSKLHRLQGRVSSQEEHLIIYLFLSVTQHQFNSS